MNRRLGPLSVEAFDFRVCHPADYAGGAVFKDNTEAVCENSIGILLTDNLSEGVFGFRREHRFQLNTELEQSSKNTLILLSD